MYQVSLKNDISFYCEANDTILVGAQKQNLNLSYSCQTGRCQSCKAKVLSGTSIAKVDEIGLSEEDKKKGYILTCVRTPTSDVVLDLDDLSDYKLESIKTLPSKINKITKISADVIELELRTPPQSTFNYLPGQYVNFIKDDYKRSYSVANYNKSSNLVFFIKKYPGGVFSNYLFNEAKINDLLRIEGPIGTFFLRNTDKKNIIFLATGTGIAPVKAILEQMNDDNTGLMTKKIFLFFGGRFSEDLFWKPQFSNINVNFIPVLSKNTEDWDGSTGYVQDILLSKSINLSDSVVYACGSENMINDSNKMLIQNGLSEDSFYSDAFVSTK
ncbi:CDP-4-dehydro-6-deoxyglucose reductase [Flavobacterium limicola]|uniref:CDP-4-dehydro-6-deoxyglucose reductase n=1 Tax=Flavobacterium limicola TaxID=180441 RepID=A0A495RRG9_9FLAO|nr:FAD-binding oxidoreductase [Flavobacterium limicola]RKS89756.1 CDP-4-dehydro-6-deoxyglucose reductase [Flavobacterium limicola]